MLTPEVDTQPLATPLKVTRPAGVASMRPPGSTQTFEPSNARFAFVAPVDAPASLVLHVYSTESLDVVVSVDGGDPRRKLAGFARRITTPRRVRVHGEVRFVFPIGDDLVPGEHTLSFVSTSPDAVWVHAPWTPRPHVVKAPRPPRWLEGDLEE